MHLKMSSGKWRPFCHGLNVLRPLHYSEITACVLYDLIPNPQQYFGELIPDFSQAVELLTDWQ